MRNRFGNLRLTAWILGIAFLGVGILALWQGIGAYVEALRARAWPTVQGKIVQSHVIYERRGRGGLESPRPHIVYVYLVNGTTHKSDRFDFSSQSDPALAFPLGKAINVHYNPSDYAQAVLRPEINAWVFVTIGMGAFFALIAVTVLSWLQFPAGVE